MNPPELAITAHQLTLRRDSKTILDDVSLSIPAGSVLGLVGRNGAGKSSLLRCLVDWLNRTAAAVACSAVLQATSMTRCGPALAMSRKRRICLNG